MPLVTILETNYKLFTMDYEHKVASLGLINILRKYCFWDSEPDMITAFSETKTLLEPCLFNLIRILNVSLVKSRDSKTSHNETEQDNRNEAALNYWDIEMMKRQKLLKHDKPKNISTLTNQEIPSQDPLGPMPINFANLGGGFDCIGNKVFRKFSDNDSDAGNSSDDYDYNDFGYFFSINHKRFGLGEFMPGIGGKVTSKLNKKFYEKIVSSLITPLEEKDEFEI